MDEYYCPNCGAILNNQYGFDPEGGTWTCTECNQFLMDDDIADGDEFDGVAWYCDSCGALLNRQYGFSDSYGYWTCTNCYHSNPINENEIYEKDDVFTYPNCNAFLNKQYGFSRYDDDYECSSCGAKLHREYSSEPFTVVEDETNEEGLECPNCGARLEEQFCYAEYEDDWECTECGAKLHRDYSSDPYEVVEEDDEDTDTYDSRPNYTASSQSSYTNPSQPQSSTSSVKKVVKLPESKMTKRRIKAFIFKRKKIHMKYDYVDLLGKNVDDVETMLYNQAFNNIKMIPIKDIYVNSSYSVGQVEQVVIKGSSYFREGDLIPYDAEIIITYHTKREITIPFSYGALKKMNYVDAGDELQKLGFTEIYERPIKDLVVGWVKKDGAVEKITIGTITPFKKNSIFTYDTKICIEYHTFKNK